MENEAKEEEAKDKEIQAEIVRKTSLKKRMGMTGMDGKKDTHTGPSPSSSGQGENRPNPLNKGKQLSGVLEDNEDEVVLDGEGEGASEGVEMDARRRASE
jgi:hypothetical protein